jgi:hypothetical protein
MEKNHIGVVLILFIMLDSLGMETSENDFCLLLGI